MKTNVIRLAVIAPLVCLCSCRGLMQRDAATPVNQAAAAAREGQAREGEAPAEPSARPMVAAMPETPSPALPRAAYPVRQVQHVPPSLPATAWTGPSQHDHVHGTVHSYREQFAHGSPHGPREAFISRSEMPTVHCPHCQGSRQPFAFSEDIHLGASAGMTWMPDGIAGPWPKDEFICDGGDLNHDVYVKDDWTVVGLDQEDTVAHYDTLDGRTEVSASNCVCIYAPRFAAVRQVTSPILHEGHERIADVAKPVKLNVHEEQRGPNTAVQPEMVVAQLGLDSAPSFRDRTRTIGFEQATRLVLTSDAFLPHENLKLIMRGEYDASEKARLAERTAAAETWTLHQSVQVIIDGKPAVEGRGLSKPQETLVYEREGKPCLRICKIADKSEARPGEIIRFTLRFDNVGDQPIGNVTIIDHLMPRLEFVAGTAESSVAAEFKTEEKLAGETLVLRWEVTEPLAVNEGGIIRFQARVR
jgi:uncharacterized repeat protein (TIGR01451 family)